MKRSRFTETQIISILNEADAGMAVKELCRKHGISDATYYNWKSKHGGMSASELKRLREIEEENAKLKKMYAELAMENNALKDLIDKKPLRPLEKREAVDFLVAEHGMSKARSCKAMKLSRSAYYRKVISKDDHEVIDALNALVEKHPRWGFWLCFDALRLQGQRWNHKRVHRVYKSMGLPRRKKRRLPERPRQPLDAPEQINHIWSLDFMRDALYSGKRFRTLKIIDDGVREVLNIVLDTSIPGGQVVRSLEQLADVRGVPEALRVDNGPEFISQALLQWCEAKGVKLRYIQPGKPNQNAYIERFNKTYRNEVLNAYLFTIEQVRDTTTDWIRIYNEERPHRSLERIPPSRFRRQLESAGNSSYELSS
ncbi:MAG: IS3 family transposase [Pseudomonadota bacterium]